MQSFVAEPVEYPDSANDLRQQVRALVAAHCHKWSVRDRVNCWTNFNPEFSKELGKAGLLGMIWPRQYGGHEKSVLERYIVQEELLAAGAPIGAHWIADRQSGTLILRYGNEQLRKAWLPRIASGDAFACIGLSEPNAGSDLASVRCSAVRQGDDWIINGQKLWTTGAHISHFMIALIRTEAGSSRHDGLSQFVIPMDAEGIRLSPITDLSGGQDFNEVFFDNVKVPAHALLGEEGNGWQQVTAELAIERAGPERYLSSYPLFELFIDEARRRQELRPLAGRLIAQLWTLRQMSLSVIAKLGRGEDPGLEASMVKDLGNKFEQDIPALIQGVLDVPLTDEHAIGEMLAYLLQLAPSFSLRGGTREVLRGIIARGLGLR
jgi:alkylation response protein AidB-like acyl-CoA dehydrogenase